MEEQKTDGYIDSVIVKALFQVLVIPCLVGIIAVSDVMPFEIGPHHITGNGVGFKPDILDLDVMEKVLEVSIAMNKER